VTGHRPPGCRVSAGETPALSSPAPLMKPCKWGHTSGRKKPPAPGRIGACKECSANSQRRARKQDPALNNKYNQSWRKRFPERWKAVQDRATAKRQARLTNWKTENGPCRCCGSTENLEIDHVIPAIHSVSSNRSGWTTSRILKALKLNPMEFQVLCRPCNGWKNSGPFCPCQVWDREQPGWRVHLRPANLAPSPWNRD